MRRFSEHLTEPAVANSTLKLTYEQRQRCVLRVQLEDGTDAGIQLKRGVVPEVGSQLRSSCGFVAEVVAADEQLSIAYSDDPLLFSRACYHLGNRHVKLQIEEGRLCYQHDHVLDDMLIRLGLQVINKAEPFHPEDGAYSAGHSHSHDHDH